MLREYQLDGRLKDFQVRAIWQRLMEKRYGNDISKVRVREGVLYVTVISSPLRQELTIDREKIREQLNEEMGEPYVREVVIQ